MVFAKKHSDKNFAFLVFFSPKQFEKMQSCLVSRLLVPLALKLFLRCLTEPAQRCIFHATGALDGLDCMGKNMANLSKTLGNFLLLSSFSAQ